MTKPLTKVLTLIRGVPGSGKSFLAHQLVEGIFSNNGFATRHEADTYFMEDGEYKFDPLKLPEAHEWCYDNVKSDLEDGIDNVIVSNTFTLEKHIEPYRELAKKYGYKVQEIWMMPFNESVHGVSEESQQRMILRYFNSMCDTAKLWLKALS